MGSPCVAGRFLSTGPTPLRRVFAAPCQCESSFRTKGFCLAGVVSVRVARATLALYGCYSWRRKVSSRSLGHAARPLWGALGHLFVVLWPPCGGLAGSLGGTFAAKKNLLPRVKDGSKVSTLMRIHSTERAHFWEGAGGRGRVRKGGSALRVAGSRAEPRPKQTEKE